MKFLHCLPACLLLLVPSSAQAQESPTVLTRVVDVRNLPRSVAENKLPVKLRAVVTYDDARLFGQLTVQDQTAGIFVSLNYAEANATKPDIPESLTLIPLGTELEIEGVTGPGAYAPVIRATRIRMVGTGNLPPPLTLSAPELQTGRYDCQRVEVRGVTQAAVRNTASRQIDIDLATELGALLFHLDDDPAIDLGALVDAEVTVQGVCLMYFNRRSEQVGTHIQVGRYQNLIVETPPPADPFGVEQLDFARLRPFSSVARALHRRCISGTVTYVAPHQFLMLQNESRAVRVNLLEHPEIKVGDQVEAAGFVEVREFYAELGNALVRTTGEGPAIVPAEVTPLRVMGPPGTPAHILPEDFDGRLISLTGSIVAVNERREGGRQLLLASEGSIIETVLSGPSDIPLPDGVRPGSSIRITGVCVVSYTEKIPAKTFPRPRSFTISLRTPQDIVVLQASTWWTPERLWIAIGILMGASFLTTAWVWTLRRRVAQRAKELAEEIEARQNAEIEFEATLRERKRLAADLHDTLEQSLTGLARQLEAADALRETDVHRSSVHLALSRQLLERSQEDVRRSVWNLHSASLDQRSLTDALHELVEHRSTDQPINLRVEVQGEERVLADFVAGNLLLLAQEGITNAFKHAAASTVTLLVAFEPSSVSLSITDDGCGFQPETAPGPQAGHFGLQGMKERVKRLGGKLSVVSAPGAGTTITAHLRE